MRRSTKLRQIVSIIITFSLSACTTPTINVTYKSQPQGAIISDWGSNDQFSMEPVRLNYGTINNYKKCIDLKGVTATWPSGVSISTKKHLKHCSGPGEYELTLTRPKQARGLENDLRFSKEIVKIRERERKSREEASRAQEMQTWQTIQNIQLLQILNNGQ